MQSVGSSSLLADRQRQTWTSIHDAAASLAGIYGTENVTISQIASEARISQRTFFNYFDSKEDAILGVRAPEISPDAIAALRDSVDDYGLLRVARLVVEVGTSTRGPGVDLSRRRQLVESCPSLRGRLSQVFSQARMLILAELVDGAEPKWVQISGLPTDRSEARALVLLAGAVVSQAWATDPERLQADPEAALGDAISLFRKVTNSYL